MSSSTSMARSWVRAVLAGVVLVLLGTASACGGDEDKAPTTACGLIDAKLVSKLADGRDWTDVGTLYRDGKFRDGCTVLVSGDQILLVTMVDVRSKSDAAPARGTVVGERANAVKACPQSTQAPATEDRVTTVCLRDEELKYVEWNPRRLIRLTLDRTPAVTPTVDDAARVSADINKRADKLEK
jgi:hypothetical protein